MILCSSPPPRILYLSGAAGPPINLIRSKDSEQGIITSAFDAFSYEPLPYRSAVKEGATHVLVLRSRPEGFNIKTKPGIYERGVAPIVSND